MNIRDAIQTLVDNAELDLMNEKDNKELKESTKFVDDWLNSPSCPFGEEE